MSEAGYVKSKGIYIPEGTRKSAKASFDSSQSGPQMAKRFAFANDVSPNTDNNSSTRKTIRNRARYESQNSTYARGISLTVANDTIGTGPRLQFLSKDRKLNEKVEAAFRKWATAIRLAEKLRTIRMARMIDGEVIVELVTNPGIAGPVQLDIALYEADFLVSRYKDHNTPTHYDGIDYDKYGNPEQYWLLEEHPGDTGLFGNFDPQPKAYAANSIIHYFRVDRPGQRRGVSEMQSSLELFNMLRTYTKATLDAAETAANHAGLLFTDTPADQEPDDVNAFFEIDLTRNMMKSLPYGWKFNQLKAEQPTTTYPAFKAEIITEIARCLNVPFNVAALNSSDYNFASGRLDHQTYFKTLEIEQNVIESAILDRLYDLWLLEASLSLGLRVSEDIPHNWYWDGRLHVDPLKEANAQAKRLEFGTTTLMQEYATSGQDWEIALEQRALELQKMKDLGLNFAGSPEEEPEVEEPKDE